MKLSRREMKRCCDALSLNYAKRVERTMKIDLTFNFQIQQGGREYNCTRTVIGERFYEQFIRVEEVGSKKDAMIYRQGYSVVREKMADTARIIAHELVEEYLRKKAAQ